MSRIHRLLSITVLALLAALSMQAGSAQMMHFSLDITIETEDGSAIPAGTVCIDSVTGGQTCQDIPDGTPSGRDFLFTGLPDGEHTITVNAGDYLEAVDYADAGDPATEVTIVLYMEETPTDLPNTGAGITADSNGMLASLLITSATVVALASTIVRRPLTRR